MIFLKNVFFNIGKKARTSIVTISFQCYSGGLSQCSETRQEIKSMRTKKEIEALSLFVQDIL